jgi:starch-binding outer membrane protein, SusD/RagB family
MKIFNRTYLIAIAITAVMAGCKKEELVERPTEGIDYDRLVDASKQDPSLLNGLVAGLYSTMYAPESGGTTGDDDFGQKGTDIYSDLIASDMVLGNVVYGWYSPVARFQATKDFNRAEAYVPWRYYYRIVFGANNVISILGGNDAVLTDPTLKAYMGQAKAMRAYALFYLANFYSEKGYGTGNEKIIPIYTDIKQTNQPLSTSAAVYTQIIKDLTDAQTLLTGFVRTSKSQVNIDVVNGLLAYAYAARGTNDDLAKVITLTDAITGKFPLTSRREVVAVTDAVDGTLFNPESGFNNLATPSWLWGADLTIAANIDLVSWWGQVDIFTYSYAWAGDPKPIDEDLYDAIPVTDIRKHQFVDTLGYGALVPANKFFAPERLDGGQRTVVTDLLYMRADEMVLLNAEAKARLGQDGAAITSLKRLTDLRMPNSDFLDGLTGDALKDAIYLQTRIELWGEGKIYLAMKRNKRSIKRGPNHLFNVGQTFTYDADELTLPIPQQEVINNPALKQY